MDGGGNGNNNSNNNNNNNNNNNGIMMMKKEETNINSDGKQEELSEVTKSIEKTLGVLHQLYLTVSSFNVASQVPLLHRINSLVVELENMSKLASNCNIQVPVDLLSLIDDGKNPDEFTRDVLNSCISKNQITKGKTDAFKSLRNHLLHDLEQAFPAEVDSYRDIRSSEFKRISQSQSNGDLQSTA